MPRSCRFPRHWKNRRAAGVIDEEASSLVCGDEDRPVKRDELAIALAQIFAGEVDFNSEMQRDDRFAVVFERVHREGRPDTYGRINAAEFRNEGRIVRAIQFDLPEARRRTTTNRGDHCAASS